MIPFETKRLSMRPLGPQDSDLYCHLFTDRETMRFIGAPMTPERAARSFSSVLAGMNRDPMERLFLTVMEKASRQEIGVCSLQDFDAQSRSVQAGVMLVARAHAQGYCKEGFTALIQQVFAQLPIDEVWVELAADHIVVERAAVSVGFDRPREAGGVWSVHRDSWLPKIPVR